MGQEFFKTPNGVFGDANEPVAEPGKRIDLQKFAGRNEKLRSTVGMQFRI